MEKVSSKDRGIVRSLATRVRALADDDAMPALRERWRKHHALEVDRPMILCFPEGAWSEIFPRSVLECEDPTLRNYEYALRSRIYSREVIRDDRPEEPFFDVGWQVNLGDNGVDVPRTQGENRGSYVWDEPIKDLEKDFDKLKFRQPTVDRAGTQATFDFVDDLMGDLLPPRIRGRFWWSVGMTQTLAYFIGMEQIMFAMMDQPDQVHRYMAFLRDDTMRILQWTQDQGLVTPHNENDYTGSGGVAYTDELAGETPLTLRDTWGFAESQETVGISPDMFAEFVLPYQVSLMEMFGLNCYGCCEGLEHRFDVLEKHMPRLRRVSVAPKADQEMLAPKLGGRYVYSRKADPVPVCVEFNETLIREDIRRTLELATDQPLEVIMKDTHTVQGDAARLPRWVEIAREEVER